MSQSPITPAATPAAVPAATPAATPTASSVQLPEAFVSDMRALLGDELGAFLACYDRPAERALRMKPAAEPCVADGFIDRPVPWEPLAYYIKDGTSPGASILHLMGAYYVQEPSAMVTARVIDVQPGMKVLDLCAAPGGKSTQLAARLRGEGLLIANEPIPPRARMLSENIERMGVSNCIVTCEYPDKLAQRLPEFFDAVLVDAPCSGEGMFRRVPDSTAQWSADSPRMCHERQMDILDCACRMLKPGGCLAYSTCTFNETENEGTVSALLTAHTELTPEDFELPGLGRSNGGMLRVWPHRVSGEGHFAARLRKASREQIKPARRESSRNRQAVKPRAQDITSNAAKQLASELNIAEYANLCAFGNDVYSLPDGAPTLDGLRVLRPGLHICTVSGAHVVPAHALARSIDPRAVRTFDMSLEQALRAVRGEQLDADSKSGYVLLTYRGLGVCWGKASDGRIRCLYPKGLRAVRLIEDAQ